MYSNQLGKVVELDSQRKPNSRTFSTRHKAAEYLPNGVWAITNSFIPTHFRNLPVFFCFFSASIKRDKKSELFLRTPLSGQPHPFYTVHARLKVLYHTLLCIEIQINAHLTIINFLIGRVNACAESSEVLKLDAALRAFKTIRRIAGVHRNVTEHFVLKSWPVHAVPHFQTPSYLCYN